jgi:hypothetical protein
MNQQVIERTGWEFTMNMQILIYVLMTGLLDNIWDDILDNIICSRINVILELYGNFYQCREVNLHIYKIRILETGIRFLRAHPTNRLKQQ